MLQLLLLSCHIFCLDNFMRSRVHCSTTLKKKISFLFTVFSLQMTSVCVLDEEWSTEVLLLKIHEELYRSHEHPGILATSSGIRQKQGGSFAEQRAEGWKVASSCLKTGHTERVGFPELYSQGIFLNGDIIWVIKNLVPLPMSGWHQSLNSHLVEPGQVMSWSVLGGVVGGWVMSGCELRLSKQELGEETSWAFQGHHPVLPQESFPDLLSKERWKLFWARWWRKKKKKKGELWQLCCTLSYRESSHHVCSSA